MVKTRSGLTTNSSQGAATSISPSDGARNEEMPITTTTSGGPRRVTTVAAEDADVYRYPQCTRAGQHGMCQACAMAGFTREGYVKYFNENPRRALPRPPVRRGAPPGMCM